NPSVEVRQIHFCHVVVSQNSSKGKEQDCQSYEARSKAGELSVHSGLDESGTNSNIRWQRRAFEDDGTILTCTFKDPVHTRGDNDERCRGAYKEGVDINRECLNKPLLSRVRYLSCSGMLWTRTLACFVGVNATANAPHDRHTQHAGKSSIEIKSRRKNEAEDIWDLLVIRKQDDQREDNINDRHERHDQGRKVRDALHTTDNDDAQQDGDTNTGVQRRNTPSIVDSRGDSIGLYSRKEICSSQDHRHREDTTVDQHEWCGLRVSIGLFNVVGRATAVLTRILVLLFVDLRQRTLNERGSRA